MVLRLSYFTVENTSKLYGSNQVLNDISLEIEKGELVTLLGPSGCGKSTLLRCISGLTEMQSGTFTLDGQEITSLAPKDREIGMVFQSYALFPNMTVYENVAFGLKMSGFSKAEIDERVKEMLQLIDMSHKFASYPHELSGGQQQRVALARSLAVKPKLLLLDEPLSALDAKIRKSLRMELRQIQKELQMTTIFVTHDQEEALMISDRVCVMDQGEIVQLGTPEEIYTSPRTEFVARFIGNYNVFARDELIDLLGEKVPTGMSFAIRPESIRLTQEMGSQKDIKGWTLQGKILSATVLGNILRYTVAIQGKEIIVDTLNDHNSWLKEATEIQMLIPFEELKALKEHKVTTAI